MNLQQAEDSAEQLLGALKHPVKIIVRATGDAVIAAVMLTKLLQEQETWFSLTFHNELTATKQVIDAHYQTPIFIDVIPAADIPQKNVIITQQETSISAYLYLLLRTKVKTSLLPYALLGEKLAKKELNKELIDDAMAQGFIDNKPYIGLFSTLQTPINKLLEQTHTWYLPGITGSSVGAVNMLQEANIQKPNTLWQKYHELRQEEKERLAEIISKKTGISKQALHKQYYLWLKHWQGKTVDEVAGVIHACIALQKPVLAYGYCLQHPKSEELSQQLLSEYHQHLIAAVQWYEEESKKNMLLQKEKACVVVRWYELQESLINDVAEIFFRMVQNPTGFIIFLLRGTLNGKICVATKQDKKQEVFTKRLKLLTEAQELQFSADPSLSLIYPLAKEESILQQVKEIVTAIAYEEHV